MVLGLVLAVCVLLVLPVARNYFNQRTELQNLANDLQAREELNQDLANQLDRWRDDKYVTAQARERLTFVFPGENPYRVMDSDQFVLPQEEPSGPQIKPDVQEPWYNSMWSSIEQAGNVGTEDSKTKTAPDTKKSEPDTPGPTESQTQPATKTD